MVDRECRRKEIRLRDWDYSSVASYYITICTYKHHRYFGEVVQQRMILNNLGRAANEYWTRHEEVYGIDVDEYVIMPNHIHGILTYNDSGLKPVGEVVGSFKRLVSRWAKDNGIEGFSWQQRYFDRIIRDDREMARIRQYIHYNPLMWELEKGSAENLGGP